MRALSILDPKFKYTPSVKTDIRKTFRRARKEMVQKEALDRILTTSFPGIYFPIPETVDEIEYAQCMKLMHQDLEHQYPWEL